MLPCRYIKFKHNDYAKNIDDRDDFKIAQDAAGANIIYSNDVRFRIEKTDGRIPYIKLKRGQRKVTI
jgi:hypothetical protein